jgi:hypothetical protein
MVDDPEVVVDGFFHPDNLLSMVDDPEVVVDGGFHPDTNTWSW